jgi:hypothetical protein
VNSVHPGTVLTDVWRKIPKVLQIPFVNVAKFFFKVFNVRSTTVTSLSSFTINNIVYRGSQSIIRIIKSRRMRWADHVARMGKEERL